MSDTTAINPVQSFAERMKERIRENASDLLTDEELKALVEAATKEVFFQQQVIERKSYGPDIMGPPLLHEIVKEVMRESIKETVDQWMKDNADKIAKGMAEFLDTSAQAMVIASLSSLFTTPLLNAQTEIRQQINNLQQNGDPYSSC